MHPLNQLQSPLGPHCSTPHPDEVFSLNVGDNVHTGRGVLRCPPPRSGAKSCSMQGQEKSRRLAAKGQSEIGKDVIDSGIAV
jgi:hypothetical protein